MSSYKKFNEKETHYKNIMCFVTLHPNKGRLYYSKMALRYVILRWIAQF